MCFVEGAENKVKSLRGYGGGSWSAENVSCDYFRPDDYSILYFMEYNNTSEALEHCKRNNITGSDGTLLNLKEHVDPSLFVLSPLLDGAIGGLELFDEKFGGWVLADGPKSQVHEWIGRDNKCMVLFAGKAISKLVPGISPTLHRVVAPGRGDVGKVRRSVIYEQKYGSLM